MQSFFFLVRNTLWVASAMIIAAITILLIALTVPNPAWRVEKPLIKLTGDHSTDLATTHQ